MNIQGLDERLQSARKAKNLTQDELALKLGVTPQAVSKWERGMGYPDLDLLCGLSNVLECSADYLLASSLPQITESEDDMSHKIVMQEILSEPVMFEAGIGLVDLLIHENQEGFKGLQEIRKQMAMEYGMLLPKVRIKDNMNLKELEYRIISYDKILEIKEYHSIDDADFKEIYQNIKEVCITNYSYILNKQIVKTLVDNVANRYPAVIDGLIPDKITYGNLQKVLAVLVDKKKSIRNLIRIIELIEDRIPPETNMARIGEEICNFL